MTQLIQALAGDSQDLGISKDQLAGFTQTAAAYRIVNVMFQNEGKALPIVLIDTPGFSDPKISHIGVTTSVNDLEQKIMGYFSRCFCTDWMFFELTLFQ